MNCIDARAALPALLYEHLPPQEAAVLQEHLAGCPACRAEQAALRRLGGLLDAVPSPAANVDLARLYHEGARREQRGRRRWRTAALASLAAAAAVLLTLVLRLEVRLDHHQLIVRWGVQPATFVSPDPPASSVTPGAAPVAVSGDDVRLVMQLLHALADDVAARDRVNQESLAVLQDRLDALQRQAQARWNATERYVSALHTLTNLPLNKE
jgi:hypothetical protein